ncbi:MAG: HTH-type transcriptional repressor FabR [Gammaproteobacteria bacterium]|nr:MAG: HTH-type transcriptional repressor FabR [Gammaproteobacteria bacterium]
MVSRVEQKRQTRRRLLKAALNQMGEDRSFATLSLREVAREAGIAPTSFYRHFQDMDELGLALVDEGASKLRQLMRRARKRGIEEGKTVVTSVEVFLEFLRNNRNLFRLMLREKTGGSATYRCAINREIKKFIGEIADELERVSQLSGRQIADPYMVAEAVVTILFNQGGEAIDLPDDAFEQLAEKLIIQLRLVLLGAEVYAEKFPASE